MKLKIARIITRMDVGGAQRVVLYLSRDLDATLFEQIVITGDGGVLLPQLREIPSIRHFLVPELSRRVAIAGLWTDLKAVWKVRRILRKERPQIVHTHTPKAGIVGRWAARLAGVPGIIHTFHGFGFNTFQSSWRIRVYVAIERFTALITTHFVAVSYQNRLRGQAYRIFPKERCSLIRSGIDFSKFQDAKPDKAQKKMELGFSPSDTIVGIVAAFTAHKALNYFVDVAGRLHPQFPQVKFVMVGDGELRPQIERQIAKLQMQSVVRLLGWRSDIPEVLSTFDVFLLTSLWEGLPRALVESVLAGVPVVASDVDGVCEVIHDGENGFLVPAGDTEAMARGVGRLLQDDSLRRRMGAWRPSVSEFSLQKMLKDHSHLYKNFTHSL
jgi:glycosyltransferase involved in cell wall biosynthesis